MSYERGEHAERVVIVGGGVLGTMHAVMARQRGYAARTDRSPCGASPPSSP